MYKFEADSYSVACSRLKLVNSCSEEEMRLGNV